MRRLRERRAEGIVLTQIQINLRGIKLLADNGWLAPNTPADSKNVSSALVKFINASLNPSPAPSQKPKQRINRFARTMTSWLF
jgi:hypothetical protein